MLEELELNKLENSELRRQIKNVTNQMSTAMKVI